MSEQSSQASPAPSKGREIKITLVLLALLGAGALYVRSRGSASKALTLEQRYENDSRIQALLFDCPYGRTFDADTSDLIPVMVSKLERGERDALRSYKEELAKLGETAIPHLRRLFDECYGDTNRTGVLTNILGVSALMEEGHGMEMATLAMEHPRGNVRLGALDTFSRHGSWEHYDLVRGWLNTATSGPEQADYMRALLILDGPRFFREFIEFLEEDAFPETFLLIATRIHTMVDPEMVQRYNVLGQSGKVQNQIAPFLVGPAARDGDESALEFLRERLQSDRMTRVQFTMEALRRVGLGLEVGPVLIEDDRAGLRKLAAEVLSELESSTQRDEWLQQGLSDRDPDVRGVCMTALIREGDELAASQALALLTGSRVEIDRGIKALTGTVLSTPFKGAQGSVMVSDGKQSLLNRRFDAVFAGDAELAQRALEILKGEYAQSPDRSARLGILKVVGRLPVAGAAELLLDSAAELGDVGSLSGMRWCAGQAFNTGVQGHAVLRARLAAERDPMTRLDLIEFVWQDHSEASREALLSILADPETHPYEALYTADRLTRMRSSTAVAPRLKQAYLASTHGTVRPALQCLLWQWYGQHFE